MIKRILSNLRIHSHSRSTFIHSSRFLQYYSSRVLIARQYPNSQHFFSTMQRDPEIKSNNEESPEFILKQAAQKYDQTEIQEIRERITVLMRKKIAPKHLEELEKVLLKLLYFAEYQNSRELQRTSEVENILFRIEAQLKQLYPHFRFLHIFALLKVLEVCRVNNKSFCEKLYSEIYEGDYTFSFDQLAFLSSTEYIQNSREAKIIIAQVCIGLLREMPLEALPVVLKLPSLIQIGMLVQSIDPDSQFWSIFEHLVGKVGSQFEGTLKKSLGISLLQLLSRNRIIQVEVWSFTISQVLRYCEGGRITLKDISAMFEAISFSHMKSAQISQKIRDYMIQQGYQVQDFYKFLNYKQVVNIITGLYTLESEGQPDNLDKIFSSYIESNLDQFSMTLVDKLNKIKSTRLQEGVRELIAEEYLKLERDILQFKEMQDTIEDEEEQRKIMEREEFKMEHGRSAAYKN